MVREAPTLASVTADPILDCPTPAASGPSPEVAEMRDTSPLSAPSPATAPMSQLPKSCSKETSKTAGHSLRSRRWSARATRDTAAAGRHQGMEFCCSGLQYSLKTLGLPRPVSSSTSGSKSSASPSLLPRRRRCWYLYNCSRKRRGRCRRARDVAAAASRSRNPQAIFIHRNAPPGPVFAAPRCWSSTASSSSRSSSVPGGRGPISKKPSLQIGGSRGTPRRSLGRCNATVEKGRMYLPLPMSACQGSKRVGVVRKYGLPSAVRL
mmetsp:Transcript_88351/g.248876  ORF Transcript_88351/g.248876 Transcript_88351/m.248876 type:complete len:265 (-) Transcript_88351:431-1225(-)